MELDIAETFIRERASIQTTQVYSFAVTLDVKHQLEIDFVKDLSVDAFYLGNLVGERKFADKLSSGHDAIGVKDNEAQTENREFAIGLERRLNREFAANPHHQYENESLGSGAAVSYSSAQRFHDGNDSQRIRFIGTLPETVNEHLRENQSYSAEFRDGLTEFSTQRDFRPKTICLEIEGGNSKLMLALTEGRKPEDLDLDNFLCNVTALAQGSSDYLIVQMGSLNKGNTDFHRQIKSVFEEEASRNGKNLVMYTGTSDFGNNTERTIDVLRIVYSSHILSMNENELDQIYGALACVTGLNQTPDNRSEKLAQLDLLVDSYNARNPESLIVRNPEQIKICHSAHGAMAYKKWEENDFGKDKELIQQILQLCVDGTTQKYLTGLYPNLDEALAYSDSVADRQNTNLTDDFGRNFDVVYAPAPVVVNPRGSLTGLGATLDGLATATIGLYFVK